MIVDVSNLMEMEHGKETDKFLLVEEICQLHRAVSVLGMDNTKVYFKGKDGSEVIPASQVPGPKLFIVVQVLVLMGLDKKRIPEIVWSGKSF